MVCLEVRQLEGQTDQNCRRLVELAEALTEQLPGLSACCCRGFLSLVLFPLFVLCFDPCFLGVGLHPCSSLLFFPQHVLVVCSTAAKAVRLRFGVLTVGLEYALVRILRLTGGAGCWGFGSHATSSLLGA